MTRPRQGLAGQTLRCPVCGHTTAMGYGSAVGFRAAAFDRHVRNCREIADHARRHGLSFDDARVARDREHRAALRARRGDREITSWVLAARHPGFEKYPED